MSTLKQLVDETTNIKNELKTCHSKIRNNLSNKGVSSASSDKMETLINKINEIPLGRKWATGSATTKLDSDGNIPYLEVKNLGFTPSVVLVNGGGWWSEFHPYFIMNGSAWGMTKLNSSTSFSSNIGTFYVSTTTNSPTHYGKSYVYNNAFRIVHSNGTKTNNVTWIAYE